MFADLDLPRAPGLGSPMGRTGAGNENAGGAGGRWLPMMSRSAFRGVLAETVEGLAELSRSETFIALASLDITRVGSPRWLIVRTAGGVRAALRLVR